MPNGHIVGVAVTGAEDDGLLFGASCLQQVVEQVLAHGQYAIRKQDTVLELVSLVKVVDLGRCEGLPSDGVNRITSDDLLLGNAGVVEIDAALLYFAGGKVTILDGLGDVVVIHRLAEIGDVVCRDL